MKRGIYRSLRAAEAFLVIADLNPVISEPIRFGSLFAAQGLYDDFWISGAVFGFVTLLLDAVGAVATADLLDRKRGARLVEKTNALIKKAKLGKLLDKKTSLATDFSITLLVGTPVTLMVKHIQSPERKREENMRLGFYLSAAASIVSAVQGGAIVAGVFHPSVWSIVAALIAIYSLIALPRWLKKRFS